MLNNERKTADSADAKRCGAEEMTKILLKLPQAEREKLFYIMKGVELTVERMPEKRAV